MAEPKIVTVEEHAARLFPEAFAPLPSGSTRVTRWLRGIRQRRAIKHTIRLREALGRALAKEG